MEKFDRDYALAAAGAAYEGNDGGLESRNYFYNYHPDYQQYGRNTSVCDGNMSNLGDITPKEYSPRGKLSPGKSMGINGSWKGVYSHPNASARPLAAGGGTGVSPYDSTSLAAAGGGNCFHTSCAPGLRNADQHDGRPSSGQASLDSLTRSKLENVKVEYELLRDNRLVEQSILLEKMLAQEMARALHDRYNSISHVKSNENIAEEGGCAEEQESNVTVDTELGTGTGPLYPSLEAAHQELQALQINAGSNTRDLGSDNDSDNSSSSTEPIQPRRSTAYPASASPSSRTLLRTTPRQANTMQTNYLNEQTEKDLEKIEACKIDISLCDQECLALQEQTEEAQLAARNMKESNNDIISSIKALKAKEGTNLAELGERKTAHERNLAEMRQTITDLRFYLRSRETLAAIPTDRVSRREVQSGTVQVVLGRDADRERGPSLGQHNRGTSRRK